MLLQKSNPDEQYREVLQSAEELLKLKDELAELKKELDEMKNWKFGEAKREES